MKIPTSVLKYLDGFFKYLVKNKRKEINVLKKFDNGFEAWLKVEFVSYCINNKKMSSKNDVGIEYKALLNNGDKKQIDIWVSNRKKTGPDRYHYIEFKYSKKRFVSNNSQARLWKKDFDTLCHISGKSKSEGAFPAEGASVLFGVGFRKNDKKWEALIDNFKPFKGNLELRSLEADIQVAILWRSI